MAVDDATAQIARAPSGKVSLVDRQVKLFADGAIISQLMQSATRTSTPTVGPTRTTTASGSCSPPSCAGSSTRTGMPAGRSTSTVNGDLGLDVLLDIIEDAMRRRPRIDHRTTIVHFANSTKDQIRRIARLGAIVSANPYYPIGFADKYALVGLGPERADVMVRSASVRAQQISLSFHSDLPMGPADPMAMAGFAVNRITRSGRVAGPEERISVHEALMAVTVGAAHSWRREHELGSVEVGKLANLTVLADDPTPSIPVISPAPASSGRSSTVDGSRSRPRTRRPASPRRRPPLAALKSTSAPGPATTAAAARWRSS